ncbi:CO dehydrogenase/CO-methylating acetyl-CoA synthase complex subunit beta [Candidatus Bathyarchaeota archaeon]|nr:MAG: CO dehydrogenase/CO-methylating acetyl-CoA synthase complex subunit beta [Candidatus Bathyarchaeota archaeon]
MSEEKFPVEVSPVYEGERIRKEDMFVELGGPNVQYKWELVQAKPMDEVEDGKISIIGPDLNQLEEGKHYPYGVLVEVAGAQVEKDLESVIERRIHDFSNYIEGYMHLNQRYDIWCRVSKKAYRKGLNSFKWIGKALIRLFKAELPFIEKMQVTFYTDPEKVKESYEFALKVYEARDARARGIRDEDVDTFYSCVLCQSFAPQHVCIITPNRVSLCGAINWFDARAAARVDPKGPIIPVPKGECIDPIRGEYTGANECVEKRSLGANKRFWLYSAFGYPHTSCGCFETIAFYIPEVDGFGCVDRGFKGPTVNGLPFSTMATQVGGGIQSEGFLGLGVEYYRSPKFFQADGGWSRIAWIASTLKERIKDAIPPELVDKIPTEKEVSSIEELKKFLVEKGHPLAEVIKAKEAEEAKVAEAAAAEAAPPTVTPTVPMEGVVAAPSVGGIRISFSGAKIKVGKLVIVK